MSAPDDAGAGSLLDHLVELRSRLLRGIVGVVVALPALLPFTSQLYTWLALPLVSRLPAGQQMIALTPAGAFFAPIKDRTRVVQGTGVSVRVDLGGRRTIKKKNKK